MFFLMSGLPNQILTVNPRLKAFSAVDYALLRKKQKQKANAALYLLTVLFGTTVTSQLQQ